MSRTIVPEEETRAADLTDLKDNIRPTSDRKVLVESDADSEPNMFYWDSDGEASNADGVTTVESNIAQYSNGGSSEGLWKRTVFPLNAASTDDLAEGSTNLYFTDERVDDRVDSLLAGGTNINLAYDDASGSLTINTDDVTVDISEDGTEVLADVGSINYTAGFNVTDAGGGTATVDLNLNEKSTDDLPEGSTSLYYTDERVDDEVDNLLEGGSNISLTYEDATGSLTIDAVGTSTDVSENGTTVVSNTNDINFTFGFDVADDSDGTVTVDLDLSEKSTDDLPEGSSNLYFTDERAQDAAFNAVSGQNGITWTYDDGGNSATVSLDNLNSFTTDDLAEGSTNLYFTDERVDDRVDSLLVGGNNITLTYDDGAGSITIDTTDVTVDVSEDGSTVVADVGDINFTSGFNAIDDSDGTVTVDMVLSEKSTDDLPEGSTNLYYTDERAQDAAAAMTTGGTNITTTYDDANDTFTIDNDVRFGSQTFSGDAVTTTFDIPHGLAQKPTSWTVQPVSDDASALSHATADATNITIVYDVAPPSGTDNIEVNYSLLI